MTPKDAAELLTSTFFNASRPQIDVFDECLASPDFLSSKRSRVFVLMALVAAQIREFQIVLLAELGMMPATPGGEEGMMLLVAVVTHMEQKCLGRFLAFQHQVSSEELKASWIRTQKRYAGSSSEHTTVVFADHLKRITGIKVGWITLPDKQTTCRVIRRILRRVVPART